MEEARTDRIKRLSAKARSLPKVPGVYLMKDAKEVVIYVGKAKVLPNRVSSYFIPSADPGPRKEQMLDLIEDFEVIVCETEWEALLTENRLIKDLHPKFNERLTDGKTYPYLVITTRSDFPGVYISRNPSDPAYQGAKVLGPFTSVYALRESVKLLQRVFRFRTCQMAINADDPKRRYFRPCLLYPIRQCSGPCADRISRRAYRKDIDRLVRFIQSKRSVMLRELRQEMEQAAAALQFEEAAALRDQVKALEKLSERGKARDGWQPEIESFTADPRRGLVALQKALAMDQEIRCIECIDIAHLQGRQTVGSKVCFVDGRPLKSEYRHYRIRQATNDDYAAIAEVISRAYREAGDERQLYPDLVIIDGGAGQLAAARAAFDAFAHQPPQVIALAKKEELIHTTTDDQPIRLSRRHPGLQLCQSLRDEAHRFAQHYHHILRRKAQMEDPPRRPDRKSSS